MPVVPNLQHPYIRCGCVTGCPRELTARSRVEPAASGTGGGLADEEAACVSLGVGKWGLLTAQPRWLLLQLQEFGQKCFTSFLPLFRGFLLYYPLCKGVVLTIGLTCQWDSLLLIQPLIRMHLCGRILDTASWEETSSEGLYFPPGLGVRRSFWWKTDKCLIKVSDPPRGQIQMLCRLNLHNKKIIISEEATFGLMLDRKPDGRSRLQKKGDTRREWRSQNRRDGIIVQKREGVWQEFPFSCRLEVMLNQVER